MAADMLSTVAQQLVTSYAGAGLKIVTAESCTGGMLATFITDVPGSSAVFERGFVTYSNEAKQELLGVDPAALLSFGAVSAEVAQQMAHGALAASRADVAVSVTGVAGPGGGSSDKPVGLVHFACLRGFTLHQREERFGEIGRDAVRRASVSVALEMLESMLDHS